MPSVVGAVSRAACALALLIFAFAAPAQATPLRSQLAHSKASVRALAEDDEGGESSEDILRAARRGAVASVMLVLLHSRGDRTGRRIGHPCRSL